MKNKGINVTDVFVPPDTIIAGSKGNGHQMNYQLLLSEK
jgi:hypothetical protein